VLERLVVHPFLCDEPRHVVFAYLVLREAEALLRLSPMELLWRLGQHTSAHTALPDEEAFDAAIVETEGDPG
jgi:hypothetical protein